MQQSAETLKNFDIAQAALLSGLKRPMVDYLCRQGILVPSKPKHRGRGRRRQYVFGDVVMLRVLAKLLAVGVSVKRLKRALQALRRHHPKITPTSLPAQYLITDGQDVFLRRNDTTLETLDEKGQMAFVFVVELANVQAEVVELMNKRISWGG